MFKIDEYVVHMTGGICQIKDITSLAISGADKDFRFTRTALCTRKMWV